MKKEEAIKRFGEEGYEKLLGYGKEWKRTHPALVQANARKRNRKGSKQYEKRKHYDMNGLPHARKLVRMNHGISWRQFKQIIAPNSALHHEWIPGTAKYRGLALVEKDRHQHGYINVIQILEGNITLFTEAEIRGIHKKNGKARTCGF